MAVPVALGWSGCRVERGILYDRSYSCETSGGADMCGHDRTGRPLTCFPGYQLGAQNFCADSCAPAVSPSTSTSAPTSAAPVTDGAGVCLSSGSSLSFCRPSQTGLGARGGAACPVPDQSCLRTDVLSDEGVCVVMNVCDVDRDCVSDPARSTCLATLVRALYGTAPGLAADHLYCLQAGCNAQGSSCPSGEVCMPRVIPASSQPADICVPRCDAQLNCPPNHFCYRKVSGPASPDICIPAILGFGCTSDLDCLMGKCLKGDTFAVCSVACATNQDCAPFGHARGPFVCVDVAGNGQRYCMNPISFGGAACQVKADCRAGEVCTNQQPLPSDSDTQPTECRRACVVTADCPRRGGLPHSCVAGTCFPGRFGVPCDSDLGCISDMRCLEVGAGSPKDGGVTTASVCSYACATDADCTPSGHILIEGASRCIGGVCRSLRKPGAPCEDAQQCLSAVCALPQGDAGGSARCQ